VPCTSDTYIWIEYVIGYARSKNIHQKDRLLQEIGLVRDQSCELFWVHLPTLFGLGGGRREEGEKHLYRPLRKIGNLHLIMNKYILYRKSKIFGKKWLYHSFGFSNRLVLICMIDNLCEVGQSV
jgi:hypothetical protein